MQRRDILTMATAAALLPAVGFAQGGGSHAPTAFHKAMVGSIGVTVLHDGMVRRADATQGLVVDVPPAAVSAALQAAGIAGPGIDNPFNPTAVQTPAGLVLIDTGFGQNAPAGTGGLLASMRAAGLDPAAVTMVVFTHFHGDHIGGLLLPDGTPAFPKAAIKVPAAEWAYWTDAGEEARAIETRQPAFANVRRRFAAYADRVERFAPGATVAPGITAVTSNGHTPGHTSYLVADGNAQLLVIGDAVTTPALFMANPEWYPNFDMEPAKAIATRRALLDRAATDRIPVVGYHFPLPGTGRVERAGSGYRLVPAA